ncbi:MAG: hypothetical protein E7576_00850 [Ruminococcaceae bacterium]|nr:hypothetical protein [Oscillospiraceae bacterium]
MKTKKRIARALALLLALSSLASCASDRQEEAAPEPVTSSEPAAQTAEETPETESSFAPDDLGEADFGGTSYVIAGLSNRTTTAVTSSELNGEVINDAQYNSARTVESRFNTVISYEDIAGDDGAMATAIRNIVSGGEEKYAVTFSQDTNAISLATAGNFHNLKSIPEFNFDQPWWIDSTRTIGVGDKYYVASSYLSYYCLYYMRVFVINKGIAADLGLEVPYQKVYEGNWYLDDLTAMAEAATLDLDGDGKMSATDRYGLSYEPLYTLQNSLGVPVVLKDADNMPYISFDVERAALYLEKMENLTGNYGFHEAGYGATMFSNGLSLMCYCNLREVCNVIRDTDLDYGFLPAPKLDELQEDYMTVATDVYWGIPISCVSELTMIGTVTEALSCQHFNFVRPAFFETTMKTKLSGSEDDTKMLDLAASKLSIDFGYAYQNSLSGLSSISDMVNSGITHDNVASTFSKYQKTMNKGLEKLLQKYEELP